MGASQNVSFLRALNSCHGSEALYVVVVVVLLLLVSLPPEPPQKSRILWAHPPPPQGHRPPGNKAPYREFLFPIICPLIIP